MINSIYLIKSMTDSDYKIGVSKNPTKRVLQHQTGNPSPLKLLYEYKSDRAYQIESTLKRRYSHLKKEGEWFDLSIKEEVSFIEDCKKIDININSLKEAGNVFI